MAEVKICGLKFEKDIQAVNEYEPQYIGMVMFCPKSSRNVSPEQAQELLSGLKSSVKKVAVVVSPELWQVEKIEQIGFDFIQIHGDAAPEIVRDCKIPIIRAVNVSKDFEPDKSDKALKNVLEWNNIYGVLFDAGTPGSGKTFDWNSLNSIRDMIVKSGVKLFLAGGLEPDNVAEAVRFVNPDVVDVSSGVEYDGMPSGSGKDIEKVKRFIQQARSV